MEFHLDEFAKGVEDMLRLHKQGANIFDMKNGNLFPHTTSQSTWHFAKGDGHIHLSDGTNTYSFKGNLQDMDTELEKMPDVPLSDMYTNAKSKGKAQVHRSDPGSIYFTLQEGRDNPTYTLRHEGDAKWKAIPKARKAKGQLKQPQAPINVNIESVKEGMLQELADMEKEADGFFDNANHALGKGVQWLANAPGKLLTAPARIGGAVTQYGDANPNASEPFLGTGDMSDGLKGAVGPGLTNMLGAGAVGAGAGGLYHLAKRHLLNTPEENAQEDEEGGKLGQRMLIPGGIMAGMNILGRSVMPAAINNPEAEMFPGK